MAEPEFDIVMQKFLDQHFSSVAQLELLLLLRTTSDRVWTADELAREMRVEAAWAQEQLGQFVAAGLVVIVDEGTMSFRFEPVDEERRHMMGVVSRMYLINRVRVIEWIYRPRSDRAQAFADAFRLKKGPTNG
jgi:hypothetical protein